MMKLVVLMVTFSVFVFFLFFLQCSQEVVADFFVE